MALPGLEVIKATDILEWAHVPQAAGYPIQAGLFAAGGAVRSAQAASMPSDDRAARASEME